MALVEFVEKNRGNAAQLRILDELAQENAFGDEANPGALRGDVLETDLVADFIAETTVALGGDARGEETGGEAARLQDDDLAVAEQAVVEKNLRDLGGFSGTGGSLDDEAGMGAKVFHDRALKFINRQIFAAHERENVQRRTREAAGKPLRSHWSKRRM